MLLGGYINLSRTPGSTFVKPSQDPEHPRVGVAREIEEEMPGCDEGPLLAVHPDELDLVFTKTLAFGPYAKQLVTGFTMTVPESRVDVIEAHVDRLRSDPAFRELIASKTVNESSGKPEVAGISLFDLDEVVSGNVPFLYPGQLPFFHKVNAHHLG